MTGSAVPAADSSPLEDVVVVESRPARIRRTLDLVRLTALVAVLLLLVGLAVVARDTARGADADLARLLGQLPTVLGRALRLLSAFAALAVPLALMAREVVRGNSRRLAEAVLTGFLAIGITEAIDRLLGALPASDLRDALTSSSGSTARPLDTYLTALLAFATVVGVASQPPWRSILAAVTAVYVLSAAASTHAPLLSLIASPVLGMVIGVAVRYAAGSVNESPDGHRVAGALFRQGYAIDRLEQIPPDRDDHRAYRATTWAGARLTVQVFDRQLIATGIAYRLYRILRLRAELAPPPALSLERVTEHRYLMALAAQTVGIRTPRLLAGLPCRPDSVVLVYESPEGTALENPTDAQLDALWSSVTRLHSHRVTHRGLAAGRIMSDREGEIILPVPVNGAVFASDLRINLDRAQVLITTAQLVGADRAVDRAHRSLSEEQLAAVLPVLQPIALPAATRTAVRQHPGLLEAVRTGIQARTHHELPALVNVERFRPRAVLSIAAIIVAGYLLVGQLSSVNLVTVFSGARWQWVPLVLAASALTYVGAALSLTGYVRERLSFGRTVLAQLAASFAGFVTPPAVGGLATNARYLLKAGVPGAGIATGLGLSQAVNAISHVVLLVGFAAATGASTDQSLPVPGWGFAVLGGVAGLGLLTLAFPVTRRWFAGRLLPPLRQSLSRLADLVTTPAKLAEALVGALILNAAYIAALWFAVLAFSAPIGLAGAAVVYLTGAAIGSVAPTPGGLGAVELALSTGLAALGVPSTAAVSGVLLFRVATFWLPVPLGWLALGWLRRRDAV